MIVPFAAFHVVAVLEVVPCTVALNGIVLLTIADGAFGEMETEVTGEAAAAAVPCNGITTADGLALVVKVSMPLTVPEAVASKVTVKL